VCSKRIYKQAHFAQLHIVHVQASNRPINKSVIPTPLLPIPIRTRNPIRAPISISISNPICRIQNNRSLAIAILTLQKHHPVPKLQRVPTQLQPLIPTHHDQLHPSLAAVRVG
jgi:hypothetical protein